MNNDSKTLLIPPPILTGTVERLGHELAIWLKNIGAQSLNLIIVLEGARPFARDLSVALKRLLPELELRSHEVKVQGTERTALLEDRKLLSKLPTAQDLGHFPVLLLDDLVDSGRTLSFLYREFQSTAQGPLKTAVLVRKFRESAIQPDFCGFELRLDPKELSAKGLKDYWLYGYGMDLDGSQRDLDHIGWKAISLG